MTAAEPEGSNEPQSTDVVKTRSTFPDLREEMDRLWATVMANPWRPFRSLESQKLMPTMDVFEKDGALQVQVELPGISAKDVDITVAEGTLTIRGEKKEEREVKEADYRQSERTYGSFTRQVGLPPEADTEAASAKFTDGVLHVSIPLKHVDQPSTRKIQIEGAA